MPKLALTINHQTEYLAEADRESAMKRYWDARQAGDPSANLVLVECPPDPDPEPPPAAPGAVSAQAQERIAVHEGWLERAGFALPPPVFAPGTRVLPLGDDNFRLERQRVEDLPTFPEAARRVGQQIWSEARRDVRVHLRDLAMNEEGALVARSDTFPVETGAFYQLATLSGFGMGGRYLAEQCSPSLRSLNVNQQIGERKNREIVLRTRVGAGGGHGAFATVTPTYAVVDTHQVLGAVRDQLEDAHTELVYNGSGVRATALWMPDQVVDLAAGDIFKVGVRIETDDTGRGRIRVAGVVWRNRCLNLIIIAEGEVETVAAVHKGDPDAILATVRGGVDQARDKVGQFLVAWGHARTVKLDVKEVLREWVERKVLYPWGAKERDGVVETLLASWQQEPGDTLADAVNAVTRAAHENPLWGVDVREELERRAARLVLVPR